MALKNSNDAEFRDPGHSRLARPQVISFDSLKAYRPVNCATCHLFFFRSRYFLTVATVFPSEYLDHPEYSAGAGQTVAPMLERAQFDDRVLEPAGVKL
jgi:hypothetical protein